MPGTPELNSDCLPGVDVSSGVVADPEERGGPNGIVARLGTPEELSTSGSHLSFNRYYDGSRHENPVFYLEPGQVLYYKTDVGEAVPSTQIIRYPKRGCMAEEQLEALGQATDSAPNVLSQTSGINSSQPASNFDQYAPRPSPAGNTPWTESEFAPRSLQAPEDHQEEVRPLIPEPSVGSDVQLSQAELEEEECEPKVAITEAEREIEEVIQEVHRQLNELLEAQDEKLARLKVVRELIERVGAPLDCAATPASPVPETEDQEAIQTASERVSGRPTPN